MSTAHKSGPDLFDNNGIEPTSVYNRAMLLDVAFMAVPLAQMPALAQAAEAVGFAGAWTSETQHDPFLPLALALSLIHI